jgi:hypothetical protein
MRKEMRRYGIIAALGVFAVGAAGWYYYYVKMRESISVTNQGRAAEPPVKKASEIMKPAATSSEISLSPLSICLSLIHHLTLPTTPYV